MYYGKIYLMKLLDNVYNILPGTIKSEALLKSISDQIKLLSWAMGGLNYLISSNNKLSSLVFIVPSWFICQYLAHYLLIKVSDMENKE
jgi:hypothetical protein